MAIYRHIDNKHVEIVRLNSEQYHNVLQLNEKYFNMFYQLQPEYDFCKPCKSKAKWDKINLNDYLLEVVESDINWFQETVDHLDHNLKTYTEYQTAYNQIGSTFTIEKAKEIRISYKTFIKIEHRLYTVSALCPVTTISFHLAARYTSPAGRNSYYKHHDFNIEDIKKAIQTAHQKKSVQDTIYHERALMTNSLRYDILKRDGFKCKICGATAQDGVKLHVDHIIPVSKGGKTVRSNLRTLCDRCNFGKRDKIE